MNTNDIHITLPASKSISNRWLVVNHFNGGAFHLSGLSTSDDTVLLRRLLSQIESRTGVFYCDNAGTVSRFLIAVLAVTPGRHFVTGDERLKSRPIAPLVDALNAMGFDISYAEREGCLPLNIVGRPVPLRKMAFIDASQSSQFVSALLLMGVSLPKGIRVNLTTKVASASYVDMTMSVLREAGYIVEQNPTNRSVSLLPRVEALSGRRSVEIEPDWSAAGYFYLLAVVCPDVRMRLLGLSRQSVQGDSVVADYFARLGVVTSEVRSPYRKGVSSLRIQGGASRDRRVYFTFRNCPDLFPAVAVACAYLGVGARFSGLSTLRLKESDRIDAMLQELTSMGSVVSVDHRGDMVIRASRKPLSPTRPVRTYGDHRIAMAFAPLTFVCPGLEIENPEVVSKSFPDFWIQLQLVRDQLEGRRTLGAEVKDVKKSAGIPKYRP